MVNTMTVTVRDRSAEAPWGSDSPHCVVTRPITIPADCPKHGAPRGTPTGLNSHDDGVWYWVQTWTNPCGCTDMYADVLREAAAIGGIGEPVMH